MSDKIKKEILDKLKDQLEKVLEGEDTLRKVEIPRNIKPGKPLKKQGADVEIDDELMMLEMPMIPLRGMCIFPNMNLHFDIGREKSINALEKAMETDHQILLTAQKNETMELPTKEDFYKMGTIVRVKQMLKLPGDSVRVLVEGITRGEIEDITLEVPYFQCRVKVVEEEKEEGTPQKIALTRATVDAFDTYVELGAKVQKEIFPIIAMTKDMGRLADLVASNMNIQAEEKQQILDCRNEFKRLEKVYSLLLREIEVLQIGNNLSVKFKTAINKSQKEYYLREQMRVIQNELGQADQVEEDVRKWREQLKKFKLSKKINEKIEKELKRYESVVPSSAESSVIKNYLETIFSLPWNKSSKGNIDFKKAEKILEKEHYGLKKVKERVLEYLAVMQLSKQIKGPIICLVGPPGVGKTSIAKSVAHAIGREFTKMSLGGVRDEAEIRGHRRTYVGSIAGRVISAISEAGTNNPVFLFDEVDKIGSDFKGDPASALLEVLDPEQNKEFMDHYLEVPFDLSKVMFITTANTTDTIPRPLLDRMEVIRITGYTEEEKVKIAEKYLIPKNIEENGLKKSQISFSENTIHDIINYYTRESGVRNLSREISNVCRKVARKIVTKKSSNYRITTTNLESYLGKKKFRFDEIKGETEIGVTTGMAWTIVGGDTLFIETNCVDGKGNLALTGQLGDVMQESAKTAISYIRSVADKYGIPKDFHKTKDLHIHIPEGATPKDGPSAGVTMFTAMLSTLTNTPVYKDVSMTGEINLRGKVLPVGGIKEKVLAAHRAGVRKVLLPYDNRLDIEEIPTSVRKDLEFVLIKSVDEALKHAFVRV